MSHQTTTAKARRILAEGRLTVIRADGALAAAVVKGDSGTYETSHDPGGWHCTCPARGRCSHAAALRLHPREAGQHRRPRAGGAPCCLQVGGSR